MPRRIRRDKPDGVVPGPEVRASWDAAAARWRVVFVRDGAVIWEALVLDAYHTVAEAVDVAFAQMLEGELCTCAA